ncbi:MAG: DUF3306 domain-containing protein [Pseudomonadota bacterium]
MTTNDDTSFLSRWSQRKRAVSAGDVVPDTDPSMPVAEAKLGPATEVSEARQAELTANRKAAEEIDLDALDYDSDYSAFFKDGVPTVLRQRAMRLLWRSNPILANVDGLCDYDENFGDPALILEKFESAYRIGKGYLFEEENEEGSEELLEAATDADSEIELETAPSTEEPEQNVPEAEVDEIIETHNDHEDEQVDVRPRVSLRDRLSIES